MPRTGLTSDQIKEKAIQIATEHIRKSGYEKLRLTEIAREIGISHAALYSHFADKSALFDAISEGWLIKLDQALDAICEQKRDPCKLIHSWALFLHKAKLEKILREPELYRAFDYSVEQDKPFIARHLKNVDRQINSLVAKIALKKKMNVGKAEIRFMSSIIREATVAFHHPKLVVLHMREKREPLLRKMLDTILTGFRLKT